MKHLNEYVFMSINKTTFTDEARKYVFMPSKFPRLNDLTSNYAFMSNKNSIYLSVFLF